MFRCIYSFREERTYAETLFAGPSRHLGLLAGHGDQSLVSFVDLFADLPHLWPREASGFSGLRQAWPIPSPQDLELCSAISRAPENMADFSHRNRRFETCTVSIESLWRLYRGRMEFL